MHTLAKTVKEDVAFPGPENYKKTSKALFKNKIVGGKDNRYSLPGFSSFNTLYFLDTPNTRARQKIVLQMIENILQWVQEKGDTASTA
jgi:hypothetical protein